MNNNYEIVNIDSVECIGEFNDEYVYDIEMGEDTEHTFFANDILVHNSLFISFFQVLTNFAEKGKPTQQAYDIVQEFEDFLNVNIKNWAIKNLNSCDPRLEFKREVMCDSGILLQKKRYVLHILDKEGIQCDDWKYTGVEIVRTTMPKSIKPYAKRIIETMILTKNKSETNKVLREAYDAFCLLNINEIALTSGIKNYEVYEQKCNGFSTAKGTPCHVKAAYYYNLLIKELGITNKYQSIKSGDKIKYFYVQKPNKYGIDAIAYKYELPSEFGQFLKIDMEKMFEKDMYMCIERFYNAMKWIPRKPNDQLCNDLEDLFG